MSKTPDEVRAARLRALVGGQGGGDGNDASSRCEELPCLQQQGFACLCLILFRSMDDSLLPISNLCYSDHASTMDVAPAHEPPPPSASVAASSIGGGGSVRWPTEGEMAEMRGVRACVCWLSQWM